MKKMKKYRFMSGHFVMDYQADIVTWFQGKSVFHFVVVNRKLLKNSLKSIILI